jgi:putative membrane protein
MNNFLNEKSLTKLEDTVTEVEKSTSAEIVIAIARFSESYRDVPIIFGFILSMLTLIFILFSPFDIHTWFVMPFVVITYFVGYIICTKIELFMRLFTREERRREQVKRAAKIAFFEESVSATKDRTGILFYLSLFEKRVEILSDLGIDGKISKDKWNSLTIELNKALCGQKPLEDFSDKLATCISFLSVSFPPGEENPDEIMNRPRIRG